MKLIDKDALVAEINKRIIDAPVNNIGHQRVWAYNDVKDIINTLEVEEVDLEKEIQDHIRECLDVKFPTTDVELIKKDVAYTTKKFFELGMAVSNKELKGE